MSKIRNNKKGFTLAEILIVVAIVIILAGVSAVSVFRYQRSLKQLELDGIAKEIFVAAQNHLTMAESQGYLGLKEPEEGGSASVSPFGVFGSEEEKKKGIYYFVVGADEELPLEGNYTNPDTVEAKKSVLSLMLPFASVDETVRLGGSYVIRYQKDPGLVLDVFYAEKDGRYPYETLGYTSRPAGNDYSLLMSDTTDGYHGANNKGNRRNASNFNNAVLGWYGGDEAAALPTGTPLKAPSIEVINAETLRVIITNPNVGTGHDNTGLKLVVKGLTSRKQKEIPLVAGSTVNPTSAGNVSGDVSQITVILDDITSSSNHFTQLFGGDGLIPGEDIEIYAVAYNNSQITDSRNGQSESHYTNSLFAYDGDGDDLTASVGYVRHLQNLEESISGFNPEAKLGGSDVTATQLNPLSWTNAIITDSSGTAVFGSKTVFVPVSPGYSLDYKGQGHSLSGFSIDTAGTAGSAGLFGELGSDDSVFDLELIDFSVTSGSGSAGALAGISTGKVTNVLAHNSGSGAAPTVTSGSGSVGGLIGSITGGTVTKSAAALVVSSTGGSAGGLIGSATGGTVSASYSGGHTDGTGKYSSTSYNVTAASGNAGGLIGDAGSAEIVNCYSTCSATGATAGGLVGSAGGSISDCYATGLVSGTTAEGAFAGTLSSVPSNSKYYMIINERSKGTGKGYEYLAPVGSTTVSTAGITALDDDPSSFNRFAQVRAEGTAGSNPAAAVAYDSTLSTQFGGKYDLQSVNRLGASVVPSDFVATHYGDWPSPEIWVINTPSGGGAVPSPYSFDFNNTTSWGNNGEYHKNYSMKMTNNTDHPVSSITANLRFSGSNDFSISNGDPTNVQFSVSGNTIEVTFNNYGNGFNAGSAGITFYFEVVSNSDFTIELIA